MIVTIQQKNMMLKMIESLERQLDAEPVPGAPEVLLKANQARTREEIDELRAEIAEFDAKNSA